jgi:hypothetical protein
MEMWGSNENYLNICVPFYCTVFFVICILICELTINSLTLILTAWEFKKAFFVKIKISIEWLKQNILKKSKMPRKKS